MMGRIAAFSAVLLVILVAIPVLMPLLQFVDPLRDGTVQLAIRSLSLVVLVIFLGALVFSLPLGGRAKLVAIILMGTAIVTAAISIQYPETGAVWPVLLWLVILVLLALIIRMFFPHGWAALLTIIGQETRALAYFNKRLHQNPRDAYLHFGRGGLYAWQGDYETAIADFGTALTLWREDRGQRDSRADLPGRVLYARGILYLRTEQLDLALNDFNQAWGENVDPASVGAGSALDSPVLRLEDKVLILTYRAMAHGLSGDDDPARQDFETAWQLSSGARRHQPLQIRILVERGKVHYLAGRYEEALADFERAREVMRSPGNFAPLVALAVMRQTLGQQSEAEQLWQLHAKYNPKFADPKMIARLGVWPPAMVEAMQRLAAADFVK